MAPEWWGESVEIGADASMNDRNQKDRPQKAAVMDQRAATRKARGKPALSREIQAEIGKQLRAYYEALIEPPPGWLTGLLRKLDESGGKDPSSR